MQSSCAHDQCANSISKPVICIMGATATGKTDAAAALCDEFDAQIISVDSSLVYRGMDIGTAKPDAQFLKRYPHQLVDIRDPMDTYSVADFYADSMAHIQTANQAGKLAILVGGTMFYFSALEQGISSLPKADTELRNQISEQARRLGWPNLHAKLSSLDADSAARIDSNDAQRIQRALEIVLSSGKTVAEHNDKREPPLANQLIKIGLNFSDRGFLHQRIEQRFDQMLGEGLEQEVRGLLSAGVDPESTAMRMIGYRQMVEYLRAKVDKNIMRDKGIAATRQLAKRQLTWMRNQSGLCWWTDLGLETKDYRPLVDFVKHFI